MTVLLSRGSYSILTYLLPLIHLYKTFSSSNYQFYPSIVTLSTSKITPILAANLTFHILSSLYVLLLRVFLPSPLTPTEATTVSDNLKYSLTETCLALNIFRQELGVSMCGWFAVSAALKCVLWAAEGRGKMLGTYDETLGNGGTRVHHRGLPVLLGILGLTATALITRFAGNLATDGPSYRVLFLFDSLLLLLSSLAGLCHYVLHSYTLRRPTQTRHDAAFLIDFIHSSLTFTFLTLYFCIIFHYYTLPLNILRELWMSYTKLRGKIEGFVKYRAVTGDMNERFPDATEEEMTEEVTDTTADGDPADTTPRRKDCIICREPLLSGKRLPCGHIFHFQCLRQWLMHQQACPMCRDELGMTSENGDRANTEARQEPQQRQDQDGEGRDIGEVQPLVAPAEEPARPVGEVRDANQASQPASQSAHPSQAESRSEDSTVPSVLFQPAENPTLYAEPPQPVSPAITTVPNVEHERPTKASPYPCLVKTKSSGAQIEKDGRVVEELAPQVIVIAIERDDEKLRIPEGWIMESDIEYIPVSIDFVPEVLAPYVSGDAAKALFSR